MAAGSIAVAMLGHKADLMLVHARKSFDALVQAQLDVSRLPIAEAFEATTSYVSVIELGMYEMTAKIHEQLVAQGLELGTGEYRAAHEGRDAGAGGPRQQAASSPTSRRDGTSASTRWTSAAARSRTGTARRSRSVPR